MSMIIIRWDVNNGFQNKLIGINNPSFISLYLMDIPWRTRSIHLHYLLSIIRACSINYFFFISISVCLYVGTMPSNISKYGFLIDMIYVLSLLNIHPSLKRERERGNECSQWTDTILIVNGSRHPNRLDWNYLFRWLLSS